MCQKKKKVLGCYTKRREGERETVNDFKPDEAEMLQISPVSTSHTHRERERERERNKRTKTRVCSSSSSSRWVGCEGEMGVDGIGSCSW